MHANNIDSYDSDMAKVMDDRKAKLDEGFTLIASENHPHPEDIAAQRAAEDSGFAGGYFEGFPSVKGPGLGRYYQGCEEADVLEEMARSRMRDVFAGTDRQNTLANLQCPSGCIANVVAYLGVLQKGDKVLAPSLQDGYGHLSHASGDGPNILLPQLYNMKAYGIDPQTGLVDYDALEKLVKRFKPSLIVAGASSYPRDIDWERIVNIGEKYGSLTMADIAHPAGPVAANILNNPWTAGVDMMTMTIQKSLGGLKGAGILYRKDLKKRVEAIDGKFTGINRAAFPGLLGGPDMTRIAGHASTFRRAKTTEFKEVQMRTVLNAKCLAQELQNRGWPVMTGGTDNHIVLIPDVRKIDGLDTEHNQDGWAAAIALEKAGLETNKNAVPGQDDSATPVRPYGVRLGTPAVSTRGMHPMDMSELAELLDRALREADSVVKTVDIRLKIRDMAKRFPMPSYSDTV